MILKRWRERGRERETIMGIRTEREIDRGDRCRVNKEDMRNERDRETHSALERQ